MRVNSTEERLLARIAAAYAGNSFESLINIPAGKEDALLEAAVRAGVAGIVCKSLRSGRLAGGSREFCESISAAAEKSRTRFFEAERAVGEIALAFRKKGIFCVIGGDYAACCDYLGASDLMIEEILIFSEKKVALSSAVPVRQIICPEEFFDEYYDNCKRVNIAPLGVIYRQAAAATTDSEGIDGKMIRFYLLHCLYRDFYSTYKKVETPLSSRRLEKYFSPAL